ncbi:hypothetical protein [Paenibacillus lemnae]|uniref:DUF4190 domain-containing protein n=1 Tax=Paenibacillus lemnae TaxID=1330551 RepID=A0A848M3M6_PAELE|nr:hypothetical protein [Paenibacillus lemnae]
MDSQFKGIETHRDRTDYPRRNYQEEYGAEMTPYGVNTVRHEQTVEKETGHEDIRTGKAVGYVGLIIGIAALFMWSVILGPIAAVTGYYSYTKGSRTLGAWSIGLGLLATISYFVLIPFAR